MPKPTRPMKLADFIRLHAYFIHNPSPLSEPTKEILREIEEHILGVIQKERNPIHTQTNLKPGVYPAQTDPTLAPNYIHYKDTL